MEGNVNWIWRPESGGQSPAATRKKGKIMQVSVKRKQIKPSIYLEQDSQYKRYNKRLIKRGLKIKQDISSSFVGGDKSKIFIGT